MESNDILRVKYYSINDMSVGFYLKRIEDVISNFAAEENRTDINEIMELYNIQQFFQNRIYSKYWTRQQINDYSRIVEKFPKVIGKSFFEIEINMLKSIFETINYTYRNDFWKLIEKYKVYEKIPVEVFKDIILSKHFILGDILECKKIVKKFSKEITVYMVANPFCAEILLNYYLVVHDRNIEPLYFPAELSE
ncbi:hypothetical protein [Feifania hominis]|uniref:Uncharacterized protein n=1 Tax=Feifania hominis TaxID=2763660 RepID=A0A926HVD7_9FIRM|nr:hypothetical protein [Feifania hominis]MBC8536511.1 hypothetical protein [Feifania hominis]